jgi:cation:H+ antiporter
MDLIIFLLSFVVILVGCEFFTNGVEWIGKRFNLAEGAVGSVLAAVGTALPETLIPLIAIITIGGHAGEEIGAGAILGAPFMLATLALFVCGISVLLFRKRRGRKTLLVNGALVRRDLKFFLVAYSFAALAAFIPPPFDILRWVVGFSLIPLYIYYTWVTMRTGAKCADMEEEQKGLYVHGAVCRLNGWRSVDPDEDIGEKFREQLYRPDPPTYMIVVQVFMGLMGIILGASMFVDQINSIAADMKIPALIFALLVSPLATELPEKFNSFMWIKNKKDTFAIGNITGAMVFQSCIPVTIGILLTPWHLNLNDTTQFLEAVSIGIALLSGAVLYWRSSHKELHMSGLMMGGALYLVFFILVLMNV